MNASSEVSSSSAALQPTTSTEAAAAVNEDASSMTTAAATTTTTTVTPPMVRPYQPPMRGHQRSVSHGGHQRPIAEAQTQHPTVSQLQEMQQQPPPQPPLKSALKGHRRVFSHGQIQLDNPRSVTEGLGGPSAMESQEEKRGHRRAGSKTEFILPPGHEERERKRSAVGVQRSLSHRIGSGSGFVPSAGPQQSQQPTHKRNASRSDSLAFSFRGHSRQASRTDSIYTLRQPSSNYKKRMFKFGKNKETDPEDAKHRTVVPNHTLPVDIPTTSHPNYGYTDNYVRTTKYTILTFLPKNLFEQFHRFANLYFLFIVLLNWVPAINAFGKEISMLPVLFVLGVTAIKDIFEDRRRYLSDKRVNNLACWVYRGSMDRYDKCLWKDLKVGDIVHLSCNDMIPADILLLKSSDPLGLCYIDTQNLDGEANLKQREVPRGFAENDTFSPAAFRSSVECDLPTTKIYRFHGSIIHPWGERVPVGKDNLLLRDCVLKNTDFIEGLVVYAGHESKAMLNNGGPRYKRSKLERQMNLEVIWCVFILLSLCFIGAVGSGVWLSTFKTYVPFLNTLPDSSTNPAYEGFLTFWTFVIILQVIIPLSLYVTLEMSKLAQVYFIHQDVEMYDEMCQKKVECRALNIPEELGQVQFMFCDKTGTLTENNMVFKRCTIRGVDYEHNSSSVKNKSGQRKTVIPKNPRLAEYFSQTEIRGHDHQTNNFKASSNVVKDFFLLLATCNTVIVAKHPHHDAIDETGGTSPAQISKNNHTIQRGDSDMMNRSETDHQIHILEEVPEEPGSTNTSPPPSSMSTVSSTAPLKPEPSLTPKRPNRLFPFQPQSKPSLSPIAGSPDSSAPSSMLEDRSPASRFATSVTGSTEAMKPLYEAESPDELALVDAAFAYGCKLLKRTPYKISVATPVDGIKDFEVLNLLPFDSVRKRMSVILMDATTKEKILFCKGADSSMFSRIEDDNQDEVERTQNHINSYATLGLRVLVMGKRILSDNEYKDWAKDHEEAENSLQMRERLLLESHNRIECKLQLLGTTAIEDKLQEGVPETIHNLRAAGINVWVLTGDKQETAMNIAYSCKLFSKDMKIIIINARSRDAAERLINQNLTDIEKNRYNNNQSNGNLSSHGKPCDNETDDEHAPIEKNHALVIDGKTLIYILDKRANLQEIEHGNIEIFFLSVDSFLKLTSLCNAVLCCRATPLQKAYIVRIVKEELNMLTLAIGDGANDVSMIQTADVGVGISGQEGMQAVMAADFAITRFKFVERLLLVHGHWNYDRLARMVLYFFYKNAAFVFVCFWYQLYCGFSGAVMIEQMYLMLYNLMFTSLPPMAIGVFDQDLPDVVLTSQPHLYKMGRLGEVYKPYSFWINMADALYQSLVIFFITFGALNHSDVGIWEFGTIMCTQCLLAMLFHLGIETRSWTILHWMSVVLSISSFFVFALIYNGVCIDCYGLNAPFWVMQHSMGTLHFWIINLLSAFVAVLPRICVRTVKNMLWPSDVSKVIMARSKGVKFWNHSDSGLFGRISTTSHTTVSRGGKSSSEMEMIHQP